MAITAAKYRALLKQPKTRRKPVPAAAPSCSVIAGVIEAVIPIRIISALNTREHHQEKARRARNERNATTLTLTSTAVCRLGIRQVTFPVTVTLTRIGPTKIRDSHDNLKSGLKATCDSIAAVLGVNDGDETKVQWKYAPQETGKHYGVRVRIESKETP